MSTCQQLIKSLLFPFVMLIAVFSIVSCGKPQPFENVEMAAAQIKPADITKESDKRFLVSAVEMKYAQILLGKLAYQRSSSEEIKMFAKMIEDANRETKSSLASLGITKSIAVPAAPTQSAHDAYDKLNESSIDDFDFTYVRFVIQGYTEIINHFESATRGNIDPDIQAKASAMLPDLRSHLSKAMELDGHLNPVSELIQ